MAISDFFKSEKPCIFSEDTGETIILGPVTSEGESGSIQLTENAVEDGSVVTDHIKKDPELVEVTTFLSDKNDILGKVVDAASSALGLTVDKLKVSEKITILKRFRDTGEIVTYSGPMFSSKITDGYDIIATSMLITSVNITRTNETGSGLDAKISLKKITIARATMENEKLPTDARKMTHKGQGQVKKEKVNTPGPSLLARLKGIGS